MKKIFYSTALLCAIILFAACKKDKVIVNPYQSYDNILSFFSKYAPQNEVFDVNADLGGTITTTKGTKIKFPPAIFRDKNNQIVTGMVKVYVKDILQPSDMILADKPTVDNKGNFLISFGEMIVQAEQNGEELNVAEKGVEGIFPLGLREGQGAPGIPMWDGDTTITYTEHGYNHLNQPTTVEQTMTMVKGMAWVDNGNVAISNNTGTESTFPIDDIGNWLNCDMLLNAGGPRITVMGYFPNYYNDQTGRDYSGKEPTMLFFKAKGSNSLIKLYDVILNAPEDKKGLHSYQQTFSVGMEGSFLAISCVDNKFYAQMRDMTIPAPESGNNYVGIDFNLSEVNENTLLSLIHSMNTK